jgi:WD40 repeat protein
MEKENEKNKGGYYYCIKCNCIPLLHLIAKENNIKIYSVCKCDKKCLTYEAFSKVYYQLNKKENLLNVREDTEQKENINIEEKTKQYQELKNEINNFNLELKNKLIEHYQNKIKEIEKLYEENKKINDKLEVFIDRLFRNYENDNKNTSNINNILNNTNINKYYKRKLNNFKYENLNDMTFIGYEKECKNYFKNQHIISPDVSELKTLKYLSGHKDSVNCFLEMNSNIGVSCSRDSYIVLYDLNEMKQILKFEAHKGGVNYMINTQTNNLISCGEDSYIKIWPLINIQEYLNNSKKEESFKPIVEIKTEEGLKKLINKGSNIIACSHKGIYIYEFNIQNSKLNLIKSLKKYKINDIILFENENEKFIIGYTSTEVFILDYSELKILNEIKCEGPYWIHNLVQINNEEVIIGNNKELNIIDIKKAQIKLTKKTTGYINSLFKLKDSSIVRGERDGIRRYTKNTLDELPPLIEPYDDYDDNHTAEQLNYLHELKDGKLVLCYRDSSIKICKLKTG